MQKDDFSYRRTAMSSVMGIAMAWSMQGPAQAREALDTVREMLRIDAQRALAEERLRSGIAAPKAPAVAQAKPPERVAVLAIYGLAGKLRAEVVVNGERKEFRQGSELARGALAGPREYRLVRIDDLCVHLSKTGASGLRVACYEAALPTSATRPPAPAALAQPPGPGIPLFPPMLGVTPPPAALVQRRP